MKSKKRLSLVVNSPPCLSSGLLVSPVTSPSSTARLALRESSSSRKPSLSSFQPLLQTQQSVPSKLKLTKKHAAKENKKCRSPKPRLATLVQEESKLAKGVPKQIKKLESKKKELQKVFEAKQQEAALANARLQTYKHLYSQLFVAISNKEAGALQLAELLNHEVQRCRQRPARKATPLALQLAELLSRAKHLFKQIA